MCVHVHVDMHVYFKAVSNTICNDTIVIHVYEFNILHEY